ncbi:putative reverse transcriptase domain-containing protein [Tanacetum coccineum]
MEMEGTMDVPTRLSLLVILRSLMETVEQYAASCFVNKALTWWNTQVQARGREAAIGMSWNDFKVLLVEEFCLSNEMEKLENEFWNHTMVRANHVAYTDRFHELAKLVPHLVTPESSRIKRKEMEDSSRQGSTWKDNKKSKNGSGVCYECGSLDHLRYDYTKWKQATGPVRNQLASEGNKNTRNNGNQARGKAFNGNAVEALQDPKVVTGTFSLINQFATVLFDSRADFSFISIEFASLLNVEPCIVNPGYAVEIADGVGNSFFTIDLIPLGQGSFDVIMRMDWLSKNKAVLVCHEKVVEILIDEGRILRVHGERIWKVAKALMDVNVDEPRISDIPVVRGFTDVFPEDFSGLPPQRQVEFRIDLVPGATSIAKSPYHLAPLKMQELSSKL